MNWIALAVTVMGWISIVFAVMFVLHSMMVRYRLSSCGKLVPSDEPPSSRHRLLHAPGVHVDDALLRAASAAMLVQKLDVLELVPGNLSSKSIYLFGQTVDPVRARSDLFFKGHTVLHATMVTEDVYNRAKVREEELADFRSYEALAVRLRRFASRTSAYAAAPGLCVEKKDAGRIGRALYCAYTAPYTAWITDFQFVLLLLLIAGVAANPLLGAIALAAYHLQPAAATLGTGFAPFDLWKFTLLRLPIELWGFPALVRAIMASGKETAEMKEQRKNYEQLLAEGTGPFFEPRRTDCPLCGGTALVRHIRVPDFLQGKPGRFTLERCTGCGHIFQNPRLSIKGLDFYYKDFYDGAGGENIDALFGFLSKLYESRAKALAGIHTPARWLDVGAGLGHFCAVAKDNWPDTRFDGLDMSESIDEAQRAGWIDHGIRGQFPELADSMKGTYDVVSMYQYLEHTREPRIDLRAANTVLSDGGYLAIEIPNPECPLGGILGKYWHPWFQPQHQHFYTQANLEKLLTEAGFTVLNYDYVQPHQPADFWWAAYFILFRLGKPISRFPWGPRPSWHAIWRTGTVYMAGFWLLPLGFIIDAMIAPSLQKPKRSNNYRVLAQKTGAPEYE
jgi:SAM-dependent methyltransferase